ncbi:DHA2 family efflux MFS transporter permease subunit [Pseudonocardia spinosispora]|uniref:DHA2 family efflux MFS transporter permease subunit n=1 Tax=Pseudonocardia spinosispora TaxID=103441 RepID=UPI00055DE5F1|nr:DHA2 family efflux MFS transporter permease subunit [Pseudonocardia spinosispora]
MTRSVTTGADAEADAPSTVAEPPRQQPPGQQPPRRVPPSHEPPAPDTTTPNWGLPLAVVVIGMFMSILDTSIVNVAVPTIQKQFSTTTEDIQWISTAYTLCLGVIVPTSAWLGERLGLKRLYLIALGGFCAASALCGMAWDLESMIVFRILQAIPGGVIPVTCLTILYKMVPKEKLGAAMGLYGLGIVVAPGVGPTLGGYLVEYVDWRLIFYINVPVGLLGAIGAIVVLPKFAGAAGRRFDVPGFICIAAGLFSLLLALSEGQDWGWTSYPVLMLIAGSASLLALFVIIELETRQPLLDVRVFTHWPFVNSLLLISIMSIGLFAVLFYVPLFLQEGQGLTAMNTGLTVLPQALVMAVCMPLAGRIYDRIGPRWPAVIGLTLAGSGTLLLTGINADMTRPELIVWMMIRAAGLGLGMMPIMTGGISSLPPSIVGSGSAFNTLTQRVTAALGLAALTALATAQQAEGMINRSELLASAGPELDPRIKAMESQGGQAGLIPLMERLQLDVQAQSYSNVFLVAGICTLAGVLLAFFLRNGKAPSTEDAEPVEIG